MSGLASRLSLTIEDVALGITRLASATIVKAIRAISVERGHDPREFTLFVYGGAGTLHARDVALDLGIKTVIIPPHPGILCAEGAMNSPLTMEFVRTLLTILS
jgi:N-methylhydantoinase A